MSALPSFSQTKYTLSGYVKDGKTGESLISCPIYIKEAKAGISTNVYGFYSISLDSGTYTIGVNYPTFDPYIDTITLNKDVRLNIELKPEESEELAEFTVRDERTNDNTESTDMGRMDLDIEQVKVLPAFMGEVDVLKTVQFLPGVQSGGEGNSGFYVRGGGPDQNLILLDEAPVYNAAHLFGFFSVFNADAIKNMEIIKGTMPANYGGRLASVLDINMKDGDYRDYHASGGIGLISSRLTVEGPIKKDTSSFILSGRRTYIDVLTKPLIKEDSPFFGTGYYFYDLNAKLNYRFSDKDRLFASGYFGRDVFNFASADAGFQMNVPWGNATGSLRWNHLFGDRLFMNATAIYSDYDFAFGATQDDFSLRLESGIRDANGKVDFTWYPNEDHNVKFGANYIYHIFTPSSVTAEQGETEFDLGGKKKIYANEISAYVLDDFKLTDRIKMNVGYRQSLFQQLGPFTRYEKDAVGNVLSETPYERGEVVAQYFGYEPRFAMRYKISDSASIKAGVSHNYQYVHLASISGISLPTDIWFPSTSLVKPQINTQYSIGFFKNFQKNLYEFSVELYYKDMNNLIEYAEGAEPSDNINNNVDADLVFGTGYSYGAEFFFKKAYGDFNGWVGYTWSKTMRIFEEINNGDPFPAKYDRRHDLSVVATYKLNEHWTFGAAFVFGNGNNITMPAGYYVVDGQTAFDYGPRNSFQMPNYHRADLSATWYADEFKTIIDEETGKEKKVKKKLQSSVTISVYNAYNRANPFVIFIDTDGDAAAGTITNTAKQVTLFPILPAVTWNFKF